MAVGLLIMSVAASIGHSSDYGVAAEATQLFSPAALQPHYSWRFTFFTHSNVLLYYDKLLLFYQFLPYRFSVLLDGALNPLVDLIFLS